MSDALAEFTPWGESGWRERALAWAHEHAGATVIGVDEPRLRAWSVIVRLRTSRGPVWFKANPPGSRFEPALTMALSQWAPGQVLAPLAVDARQGWSLLPDGGTTIRDVLDAEPDLAVWEELLRQYAALQRASAPHVPEMLRIGVPDLRANTLPTWFDELLAAVPAEQYATLSSARPMLLDRCEALAASSVPATLDHSDLHENQVFVAGDRRFVFFDWGDASIGHPFTSLLVVFRAVRHRFGVTQAELDRLRDAYLEPWTAEHPVAELRDTVEAATRLGAIARANSWRRIFPEAEQAVAAEHTRSVVNWLLILLGPTLIRG